MSGVHSGIRADEALVNVVFPRKPIPVQACEYTCRWPCLDNWLRNNAWRKIISTCIVQKFSTV